MRGEHERTKRMSGFVGSLQRKIPYGSTDASVLLAGPVCPD